MLFASHEEILTESGKVRDVTIDNRASQLSDSDCGGRLGPIMPDGGPDLRNLRVCQLRRHYWAILILPTDLLYANPTRRPHSRGQ